ncbi:odorant receptor 22c-like [Neodiprion fabricii]|uniref:odorant receptor 22c-like n=1 Tax=Neodiprion fabricii TaxID=2872261 RepID=UPI001ED959B0|nr:odorant receptor 22c-like [Neodiprion fabricii]
MNLFVVESVLPSPQADEIVKISDLLGWTERMLTPFGMWPKDKHDLRFAVSFVYMAVHVGMECADFTRHMGDLQNLLDNLSETTIYMILFAKVIVFHKNRILAQMIDAMNEDRTDFKNNRSIDEQRLYAAYNAMAKTFFKILVPLVFSTAILYYLRPLAGLIFSKVHNGKTPYVLPYRTRYSFEITEVHTYVLAYLYQGGTLPLVTVGLIGSDGLFITLMLHICGELSILSSKIAALKEDKANFQHSGIRSIVKRHTRLMWMAEKMDKAFTIVLLGQLFGSSLLICLNGFNVIVNSERVQRTSLITFAFYEASMLTFLYAYCFIGECLIQESKRFREACYECAWYDIPPHQARDLILCMARAQQPLYLTAGKIYIFSLENFTQIIKTTIAYLSVLRTLT